MAIQRRYFQMTLDTISRFEAAKDHAALQTEVKSAIGHYGYQSYCFVSAAGVDRKFSDKVLINAWPKGWFDQYIESGFHPHDPVATALRASLDAFRWRDVIVPDNAKARLVMSSAADDFNLRYGFCIPIHGLSGYQAGVSLAGETVEDSDEAYAALELTAIYAFTRMTKLKQPAQKSLTSREREVVSWIAAGKSAWDTGGILNIAEDTVNKHIKSAMRKLDVHTRAQAVAESIRRGEIAL